MISKGHTKRGASLDDLLDNVQELPPSVRVLPRLQNLLRREDTGLEEILDLLRVDASLTARIIRMANTPYFSGGQPCDGLDQAIQRLGFQTVYQLIATASTQALFDPEVPLFQFQRGELMVRSVSLAFFLSALRRVRQIPDDTDALYTAGLLHGIGKVAINQYFNTKGFEIFDLADDALLAPGEEVALLGYAHTEAAAALLESWKFAPLIVTLIRYQEKPEEAEAARDLVAMMHSGLVCLNLLLDDQKSPLEVADEAHLMGHPREGEDWELLVTEVRADLANLNRQL